MGGPPRVDGCPEAGAFGGDFMSAGVCAAGEPLEGTNLPLRTTDTCKKQTSSAESLVLRCAADLHTLWVNFVAEEGRSAVALVNKFGHSVLDKAYAAKPVTLQEPAMPERCPSWSSTPCTTERQRPAPVQQSVQHPDLQSEAKIRDLSGTMLQSLHEDSERYIPSANHVVLSLEPSTRRVTVCWLIEACLKVNVSDSVLHTSVLLLDRYCAKIRSPFPTTWLQPIVLCMVSIASKFYGTGSNDNGLSAGNLVTRMCRGQVPLTWVMAWEHAMLKKLEWAVFGPSPLDILDTLMLPAASESPAVRHLASFLLQLTLMDVEIQYRYPHVVLAAGALYVALTHNNASPKQLRTVIEAATMACKATSRV